MTAWLPVPEWEGYYEVSDDGQVRSLDRVVNGRLRRGRLLSTKPSVVGYPRVALTRGSKPTHTYVHTLVLAAFAGPRPDGMEACHGDGDRTNNTASNLRWDTRAENAKDRIKHDRHHWFTSDGTPRGSNAALLRTA